VGPKQPVERKFKVNSNTKQFLQVNKYELLIGIK